VAIAGALTALRNAVSSVYVRPDGGQLSDLAQLLAAGQLKISLSRTYGLLDAADALATAVGWHADGAVALTLEPASECAADTSGCRSEAPSNREISRPKQRRLRPPHTADDLAPAAHPGAQSSAGGVASPQPAPAHGRLLRPRLRYSSRSSRWSPTRSALAMAVSPGFTALEEGKKLVSTT
jgi:hypothetical protein